MLGLFCGLTMASALVWSTPQPVTDSFRQFYSVSNFAVNSLSMVYMLTYVLGLLPASYVLGNLGTRVTLLFGAAFTVLGASIRAIPLPLQHPSFVPVAIGQTLAGIGQCFTLGAPPQIAAIWFPPSERGKATAVGTVANALGSVLSFAIGPPLALDIPMLLLTNSAVCSVVCLLILALFRERPPLPPTVAQSQETFELRDFFSLLKDTQFMLLALGTGFALGSFWAIPTMLAQSIVPQGYSETDAGNLGMVLIGAGLVGSFAAGFLLDLLPRWHKFLIVTAGTSGLLAMIAYTLSMVPGGIIPLYIAVAVLGMSLSALIPLSMEAAAECAFPLPEPVTAGVLCAVANAGALLLTAGMSLMQNSTTGDTVMSNWFATIVLGISVALLVVWRFNRKRSTREASIRSGLVSSTSRLESIGNPDLDLG